jgi:hypothetical protein
VFSLFHTTDDSDSNFEGGLDSTPDTANIMDANAFEELAQNIDFLSELAPISDQPTINDLPGAPTLNHAEAQPNQHEVDNMGTAPIVVIDHFPSGQVGAPIPGMAHRSLIYESYQDTYVDTEWVPFTSQCNWLFAHWAKMHSLTSSSLDDLLGIPEVCCSSPFLQ